MSVTPTTSPLDEFESEVWNQPSIHQIIARAMARPDAATFKFDAAMVNSSKPLWDWAEYLVDHYVGTFELMVDLRTKQRLGRQLSENQLKVALNTLLNVWRRSLRETQVRVVAAAQAAKAVRPIPAAIVDAEFNAPVDFSQVGKAVERQYPTSAELFRPELREQSHNGADLRVAAYETRKEVAGPKVTRPIDGTYTYVTGDGEYRVVRFVTPKDSPVTFVSYQYGSDNEADFAKCGRINGDGSLIIWQRGYLKGDQKVVLTTTQRADLVEAIVFICSLDKDDLLKSGEAYALRSGNCFMCGRTLTVPSSISAGIGPVCAKRWGI